MGRFPTPAGEATRLRAKIKLFADGVLVSRVPTAPEDVGLINCDGALITVGLRTGLAAGVAALTSLLPTMIFGLLGTTRAVTFAPLYGTGATLIDLELADRWIFAPFDDGVGEECPLLVWHVVGVRAFVDLLEYCLLTAGAVPGTAQDGFCGVTGEVNTRFRGSILDISSDNLFL